MCEVYLLPRFVLQVYTFLLCTSCTCMTCVLCVSVSLVVMTRAYLSINTEYLEYLVYC